MSIATDFIWFSHPHRNTGARNFESSREENYVTENNMVAQNDTAGLFQTTITSKIRETPTTIRQAVFIHK